MWTPKFVGSLFGAEQSKSGAARQVAETRSAVVKQLSMTTPRSPCEHERVDG